MASATIRGDGTSMISPFVMPAMLMGTGFTWCGFDVANFSVQDFAMIVASITVSSAADRYPSANRSARCRGGC